MKNLSLKELIEQLVQYRKARDFIKADNIRDFLLSIDLKLAISKDEISILKNDPIRNENSNLIDKYFYKIDIKLKLENDKVKFWYCNNCRDLAYYWSIQEYENFIKGFVDATILFNEIYYKNIWVKINPNQILARLSQGKMFSDISYRFGIKDFLWTKFKYNFTVKNKYEK